MASGAGSTMLTSLHFGYMTRRLLTGQGPAATAEARPTPASNGIEDHLNAYAWYVREDVTRARRSQPPRRIKTDARRTSPWFLPEQHIYARPSCGRHRLGHPDDGSR